MTVVIRSRYPLRHDHTEVPIGPVRGIATGAVVEPMIASFAVTAPKIATGAVITEKVADLAVTLPKLETQAKVGIYYGDETEVAETATTYTLKKTIYVLKGAVLGGLALKTMRVLSEVRTAGGGLSRLRVTIGPAVWETTFTSTAWELRTGTLDVAAIADGLHTGLVEMHTTAGEIAYNRTIEFYGIQ